MNCLHPPWWLFFVHCLGFNLLIPLLLMGTAKLKPMKADEYALQSLDMTLIHFILLPSLTDGFSIVINRHHQSGCLQQEGNEGARPQGVNLGESPSKKSRKGFQRMIWVRLSNVRPPTSDLGKISCTRMNCGPSLVPSKEPVLRSLLRWSDLCSPPFPWGGWEHPGVFTLLSLVLYIIGSWTQRRRAGSWCRQGICGLSEQYFWVFSMTFRKQTWGGRRNRGHCLSSTRPCKPHTKCKPRRNGNFRRLFSHGSMSLPQPVPQGVAQKPCPPVCPPWPCRLFWKAPLALVLPSP